MPFCPECKSAYREGISECPECKTTLVKNLKEGETTDFIEVFKASSLVEAEAIEASLTDAGIECILTRTAIPTTPLMGEDGMVVIEVRADQVDAARGIIKDLESAPPFNMDEASGG